MSRDTPIPALGKLAWHESWAGFGEGPFTLLAKLRALNSVRKSYFLQLLGSSNRISLVNGLPARDNPLSKRIYAASATAQFGTLFSESACDERLRFCQRCLSTGYHAALCQLDIFDLCPIHRYPLLDRCTCCQHPTPRFALVTPGGFPSFKCSRCKLPLAGGRDITDSPSSWTGPTSFSRIKDIHAWAASAASRVSFPQGGSWITCAPQAAGVGTSLIGVLLHLHPCPKRISFRPTGVEVLPPILAPYEVGVRHTFSYTSIASMTLPAHAREWICWRGWATLSDGLRVPVDLSVSVLRHAVYIWRCQFEDCSNVGIGDHSRPPSDLRFDEPLERWVGSHLSTRRTFIDERMCLRVAHVFFRAALRVAEAWGAHREDCVQKGIKPAVSEAWLARLGRWDLLTASPVGLARCSSGTGTELIPFIG